MARRSLAVRVAFESGFPMTDATAVVVDRDLPTRVTRAGAVFGLCFAFAFLGLFVPLMHLILPPTLLLTGLVLAALRLRERVSFVELRGFCPRCREDTVVAASGPFKDKRAIRCHQCAEKMTISAMDAQERR